MISLNPFVECYEFEREDKYEYLELSDFDRFPSFPLIDKLPNEIVKEILKFLKTTKLLELLSLKNKKIVFNIFRLLSERGGNIFRYASAVFNQGFNGTFFINSQAITLPQKLKIQSLRPNFSTRHIAYSFIKKLLLEEDQLKMIQAIEEDIDTISCYGNTRFCTILTTIQNFIFDQLDAAASKAYILELQKNIAQNKIHKKIIEKLYLSQIKKNPNPENKINFLRFKISLEDISDETKNLVLELQASKLEELQQNEVIKLHNKYQILSKPAVLYSYTPRPGGSF